MIILEGNFLLLFLVFFPFVAGFAGYLIGRKSKAGRDFFAIGITAVELAGAIVLCFTSSWSTDFYWNWFAGFGLHFRADGFRLMMGVLAGFIWLLTTIQSREYLSRFRNRNRYYLFMLWTLGATMGIFLSANLYTTFIFFEIMSFTSYVLVIHNETDEIQDAAKSYVGFAVLGGLATLMGLFMLQAMLGTLEMDQMMAAIAATSPNYGVLLTACILVLVGFGVKAGMYPLHTWLPQSYLSAPSPATTLLSAILSKAGVFGIFVVTSSILLHDYTWGMIILCLGVLTMLTGAILAVFSVNLKRTLGCSSMSQIGFILVGTGMQGILGEHNALAVQGSILHLLNHSLIKLALFMGAGVIFVNLKNFDLNRIRGFGRKKPVLMVVFGFAILGIIGMPLWNGYISKTLIHESIVEYIAMFPSLTGMAVFFKIVEALFTFTGGLTCCYMLKIFIAVFIEKNPNAEEQSKMDQMKKYMSKATTVVLAVSAIILPVLGVIPHLTMDKIAQVTEGFLHGHGVDHAVAYFSWTNMKGAAASLSIGVIVYFLIVRVCLMKKDSNGHRIYINAWPQWLNIEKKFYRPVLLTILPFVGAFAARTAASVVDTAVAGAKGILFYNRPERFKPPLNNDFGTYNEEKKPKRIPNSLAYSLLLFGCGIVFALFFILIVCLSGWR